MSTSQRSILFDIEIVKTPPGEDGGAEALEDWGRATRGTGGAGWLGCSLARTRSPHQRQRLSRPRPLRSSWAGAGTVFMESYLFYLHGVAASRGRRIRSRHASEVFSSASAIVLCPGRCKGGHAMMGAV
eukprot:gene26374-17468_t